MIIHALLTRTLQVVCFLARQDSRLLTELNLGVPTLGQSLLRRLIDSLRHLHPRPHRLPLKVNSEDLPLPHTVTNNPFLQHLRNPRARRPQLKKSLTRRSLAFPRKRKRRNPRRRRNQLRLLVIKHSFQKRHNLRLLRRL